MVLQEFIKDYDKVGFVADNLKDMRSEISMMNVKKLSADYSEHNKKADGCFYFILGYIQAAYCFGYISCEESNALSEELLGLFN